MESEKRKRRPAEVRVQVERGGVTQPVRGVLSRSAGGAHCGRWTKVKVHLLEGGRSLAAFVCGLMLAALYGAASLLLQKQPLWLCVHATLAVAVLAGFGMGLSAGVRADVTVMLPSLCSGHGRNFLLFLFSSLLLSGPITNTLENTERAAASLLCGAELAANQTQELMRRSATPLFSALNRIRDISSNALAAAGRVQQLIDALTDSVRHVARTLRNVLHFLVDLGDVCNAKLGSPYRKCRAVFAAARADCADLLAEFNFLCDIVDGFLPLCSLARAGELFCIVPSYVGEQLKNRLAAPTLQALERMKQEFDFNLSASVTFDLDANSSRSVQQVSQDVMEEVSSQLQVFQRLSQLLVYGGLVLLACCYTRAARYRRRYLRDVDFDNVYISAQFEELDRQVTSGGGASVLPITASEARTYIAPLSLHLTERERRAALGGVVSVLRHLVMGGLLVALDFLVFWVLDQVHHQVTGDVVARAPVRLALQVNGSGYASDIFRDLVASFNVLQGGNITVISRKCLLEPSEPDHLTCFILGFLLGLVLLVSLTGGFVQRCRRLICASYHPERELDRIQFLRQQILDQRRAVRRALRGGATRSQGAAGGAAGAAGGAGAAGAAGAAASRLQTLLQRFPAGARLSHLLGLSSVSCLTCGQLVGPGEDNMAACGVPQCPGLYCRPCFTTLGNVCVVCERPLTSQEDGEEELCVHADSDLSEADMTYQDRSGSDSDSDSDASFYSTSPPKSSSLQDQDQTRQDPAGPSGTQDPDSVHLGRSY